MRRLGYPSIATFLAMTYLAQNASAVSISTFAAEKSMPDYDMSSGGFIDDSNFGFKSTDSLLKVQSVAVTIILSSVDPGTTLTSLYINYKDATSNDLHACPSVRYITLKTGSNQISCDFGGGAFVMKGTTSYFVGFTGSTNIGKTLHLSGGSTATLVFSSVHEPNILSLDPAQVTAGGSPFNLSATGTNFGSGGTMLWNSISLSTSGGGSQVSGFVSSNLIASPGSASISLLTSDGFFSNPVILSVNAVPPLVITTSSLPAGAVGVSYSAAIGVSYGTTPYSWALTNDVICPAVVGIYCNQLPPGLSVSPTSSGFSVSGVPITSGTYNFDFTVTDKALTKTTQRFSIFIDVGSNSLQFVPVPPCRVADTRDPPGALGGPSLSPGIARSLPLPSSSCAIPSTAKAYSVNVTVVPKTAFLGYLTLWPTGQPQAIVSTLNSWDGSVLSNAAIVPAGTNGAISVFSTDSSDLIIDINGYFTPPAAGTLQFYPVSPCRIIDTRAGDGFDGSSFGPPFILRNTSRSFPVPASNCGVPALAQAYSLNVTVVPHGFLGYLTVWPTDRPRPVASTLNSWDGSIRAVAAIVPGGSSGSVSFYSTDDTDVVVDINGYFAPPSQTGLNFYSVQPCRVVDTRNPTGQLGGPAMGGNSSRTFPIPSGSCGLPGSAGAYSFNITVVPPGPLGYLTAWPSGVSRPATSILNALKGIVLANAAIVPAGTSGAVDIFVASPTDVVIDTNGYFAH